MSRPGKHISKFHDFSLDLRNRGKHLYLWSWWLVFRPADTFGLHSAPLSWGGPTFQRSPRRSCQPEGGRGGRTWRRNLCLVINIQHLQHHFGSSLILSRKTTTTLTSYSAKAAEFSTLRLWMSGGVSLVAMARQRRVSRPDAHSRRVERSCSRTAGLRGTRADPLTRM